MKLKENALVLFKNQPALISGLETDKIEITTSGGKIRVREKDVILLHEGPVKDLKKILFSSLPSGDISEALEFFAGETPSFKELTDLVWGSYPPETAWIIWKTLTESPWLVCTSPGEPIILRARDEAEAIIRKAEAKREEGSERDAFHERLKKTLAGGSNSEGGTEGGIKLPEDGKFLQDIEALALGKTEKSKTLKEAGISETPQAAHRLLLKTGYWETERNPWPARHGHTIHSSAVQVDAPDDTDQRLDLTALSAWAIDNEWSNDPDDAVSVDGDKLWVHIADPASTVTPDSPSDRDARSRGSTLYIPEGAARMLADITLDYYALGLQETSRALSFCISLTATGAIGEVSIHRTHIHVERLTYAQATSRKHESGLAPLFAIAERNIRRRMEAGAVSIELPEVHIFVKENDAGEKTVKIEQIQSESAADMVREMMLLAGEAAARFAFKNAIPFQYVSQETPDIPKELPPGLAGEYRKRRSMKSRKVGTIPSDHAGLGIGMYSQVTSPLRRYGDLIAHQQIHLFLDKKPLMDTDEMLLRIAEGDSASRESTQAERKTNLHWVLVFLAKNPDWKGDAVVVEKNGSMATILIPELGQEAKINLKTEEELNTVIHVQAGNINIPELNVMFSPVSRT